MHSNKPRYFILHEKKLAERNLTLRHIGHTRTNNECFKLVEVMFKNECFQTCVDLLRLLFRKYKCT